MTQRRINLIAPTAWVYGSEMALGVLDEAPRQPTWTIHLLRDNLADRQAVMRWLKANPADGAIVLPRFSGCASLVANTCPATVTVCDEDCNGLPRVGIDDEAVGQVAGSHLRGRGLLRFAYARNSEGWSGARERGFKRGVGANVAVLAPNATPARRDDWLTKLRKPVGLFAGNDHSAASLLEDCRRLGLSSTHDIALVGANNDQLLCLSTRPALSSVRIPWREVGRTAARALAMVIDGQRPAAVAIQPLGVAVRPSTDQIAIADTLTARVVAFIRAHVAKGINVEDIIREVGCSRSQLERHLRTALGHGPLSEIRRTRVDFAIQLLCQSDDPLSAVARASGFPSLTAMHTAFKLLLKHTPLAYRTMMRGTAGIPAE